jgi:asparagine synthase (glutamine-hydrolysing)
MCGIAGIWYADAARPLERERLQRMAGAIRHRGPDGEGCFVEPGIGLAHRRLSIIDLAGGQQPLSNEDGSIQVVFNGEIYNYRALRATLEAKGHRFTTHSDTEVLVHLYEERGPKLVDALRGMFAFAIWDRPRRQLLLARDRVGIKPLYYYRDAEKLLFCSELKGILAYGGIERTIAPAALDEYLAYGMIGGERSIFQNIYKLPPAHVWTISAETAQPPRRYWHMPWGAEENRSEQEWCEAVQAKVAEAVESHLVSDVPVGAFLSGGLDSSIITAIAAQRSTQPLHTFSIGFAENSFNELPAARLVAKQYGTEHTEEIVTANAVELLTQLCWNFDEPFADSSMLPTFLVSRLASRKVKVVLSGDGGDEAFGGYSRYVHDLWEGSWRRKIPRWVRRGMISPLAHLWPTFDWLPRPLRAKSTLTNLSLDDATAYAHTISTCRIPLRHSLLNADVLRALGTDAVTERVQTAFAQTAGQHLSGMIAADMATLLPDDYLVKVDRASMACGLEVRPPLLDHELLELTARIPACYKIRERETKWVFKQACGHLLPPELMQRPKQGFEIPVDAWFRTSLRELFAESVLSPQSLVSQWLDRRAIQQLWQQHDSGQRRLGQVLWSLLVFAHWLEMFAQPEPLSCFSTQ